MYNRTTRGYCNMRLLNGKRQLKRTLWFEMDVLVSTRIPNNLKKLAVTGLQHILTPLCITVYTFALFVTFLPF